MLITALRACRFLGFEYHFLGKLVFSQTMKDEWRISPSVAQARNPTSATSSGRTKRARRASSVESFFANGFFEMVIASRRRNKSFSQLMAEAGANAARMKLAALIADCPAGDCRRHASGNRKLMAIRAFRLDPLLPRPERYDASRSLETTPSSPRRGGMDLAVRLLASPTASAPSGWSVRSRPTPIASLQEVPNDSGLSGVQMT
jgi:hypothetical protein